MCSGLPWVLNLIASCVVALYAPAALCVCVRQICTLHCVDIGVAFEFIEHTSQPRRLGLEWPTRDA
jgi:hypothetical protein